MNAGGASPGTNRASDVPRRALGRHRVGSDRPAALAEPHASRDAYCPHDSPASARMLRSRPVKSALHTPRTPDLVSTPRRPFFTPHPCEQGARNSRHGRFACAGSTPRRRRAHPLPRPLSLVASNRRASPSEGDRADPPTSRRGAITVGDAFNRRLPPTRSKRRALTSSCGPRALASLRPWCFEELRVSRRAARFGEPIPASTCGRCVPQDEPRAITRLRRLRHLARRPLSFAFARRVLRRSRPRSLPRAARESGTASRSEATSIERPFAEQIACANPARSGEDDAAVWPPRLTPRRRFAPRDLSLWASTRSCCLGPLAR